jgi:hypothetical protein
MSSLMWKSYLTNKWREFARNYNFSKDRKRLPNICGSIDRTQIPLIECPSKKITLVVSVFS